MGTDLLMLLAISQLKELDCGGLKGCTGVFVSEVSDLYYAPLWEFDYG